ncbi:MAG: adenylate/guanylate cyclase domain-containing protein [Bacteroidia bacterium]|nr:adenylate/guanylate cyclase domain-containing protein [Bacteroidia bacterium]
MFDAFCIGTILCYLRFEPWPTMFFTLGLGITSMSTGGFRYFLRIAMIAILGILFCGLFIGFQIETESTMHTTLIASVGMTIFFLFSSFVTYNLTRQIVKIKEQMRLKKDEIEGLAGKLAKYLSPQVYGSIFSGEKEVKIETNRKKLTIFFSDIKDFTSITDSMEAEGLTSLLNTYFNEMSKIALKYGGTIDKFIGDAIMIFFGDPESKGEKRDAEACVLMAMEMRDRMREMREEWAELGLSRPLQIRMGINTGYCTVGNFGSEERMDYTIIGNQVNLASRLESNAEATQILISRETYTHIKETISCQKKEEIHVKGIPYPVQTYQVIDLHENIDDANKSFSTEREGFSLSVDLNRVSKEEAKELLNSALMKL